MTCADWGKWCENYNNKEFSAYVEEVDCISCLEVQNNFASDKLHWTIDLMLEHTWGQSSEMLTTERPTCLKCHAAYDKALMEAYARTQPDWRPTQTIAEDHYGI